ncbi:MAG: formylglycine-generating enzyme family protein [Scytonema sp. PMC 1069.18]|nr:formylglycine-generating enzyme family protein [Scytonema sp. PMC 1069.18]
MEEIIAVLSEKLGLTAEEITDILWLALLQWQSTKTVAQEKQSVSFSVSHSDLSSVTNLPIEPPESSPPFAPSFSDKQNTTVPLYSSRPQTPPSSQAQDSLPLSVPNAPAIRNSQSLLRSLRPLMQRVPSQTSWVLDEEATVECIAETKLWFPQRKPMQVPWFELALVVDASPTMLLWQRHILELRRLLAQTGAFRDVRTWSLDVDSKEQLYLHPKLSVGATHHTPRTPEELIDPTGRRLILVVSDCISTLWESGTITTALKVWAEYGPMALVQMLPEWLWDRTALSEVPKVRFHSLAPGVANQKLSVVRRDRWRKNTSRDIKVPIFTLEPPVTSLWSQMVAGKGNTGAPGLLFLAAEKPSSVEVIDIPSDEEISPLSLEERVQRFRVFSSPIARRLAGLLAACPVVSLPIVRMIQDAMLPQSQQVHVAEVLLSGLFKLANPIQANTNPDEIEYKFDDEGIRRILLDSTPAPDTFSILSKWIEHRLGKSLEDFIAIVKKPQSDSDIAEYRPFAGVAMEVLKRQGSRYANFATDLEKSLLPDQDAAEAPIFPNLPPLHTFEFDIATLTIEDEVEAPPGIDLQPFEFEVATIQIQQLQNPIKIAEEAVVAKTGKSLNDLQKSLIEGTLNNQTYNEIATSIGNDPKYVKSVGTKLWQLLTEAMEQKVTKTNLKTVLNSGLTIQRRRQQAQRYIETLGNGVQLEMVAIPEGSFLMGSPEDEPKRSSRESPQHRVTIKPFFLGKYPITQAQWQAVASLPQVNRELDPNPSRFKGENRPVENVSWYDTIEFCERLSQYTGKPYRLPSEAEWEYACRGGTTTPFHFGETITSDLANYNANYTYGQGPKGIFRKQTTPVGSFGVANAFGLYDMHGNVWEWCADHWHDSYEEAPVDGKAWIENDNDNQRMLRGGSWYYSPVICRSACRNDCDAVYRSNYIGFRVACAAAWTQ